MIILELNQKKKATSQENKLNKKQKPLHAGKLLANQII